MKPSGVHQLGELGRRADAGSVHATVVGGVTDNRVVSTAAQFLDIVRGVVEVDVASDCAFAHREMHPVGDDPVHVEPALQDGAPPRVLVAR